MPTIECELIVCTTSCVWLVVELKASEIVHTNGGNEAYETSVTEVTRAKGKDRP